MVKQEWTERVKKIKGQELLEYQSVENWFDSLDTAAQRSGKEGLTLHAKRMRLGRLWEYTNEGKISPDELLKEAQSDINKAGKRLKDYFNDKVNSGIGQNTAVTDIGFLRGFYTHNNLVFPKKWGVPKRKVSKVAVRDEKTTLYDYDGDKGEVVFKNGTLQHFVQNLNFRDQTIALSLLSTGADATDVLNLNMSFVKDGKGKLANVKRFFWRSNRAKTGEEFKTFFSEEATEFLKRYVEQERSDASDDEPLFPREDDKRLDVHALAINFRVAAKKMGYTKDGVSSPFRPKRFRHWFRTACGIAHIEEGYTKAMMGHANDVSAGYLERNKGLFEMEYVKVEPFVTVFGINKTAVNELSQKMEGLKDTLKELVLEGEGTKIKTAELAKENADLKKSVKEQGNEIQSLKAQITSMYNFVQKNLDPVLDLFNEVTSTPEGKALIKKIQEENQAKVLQDLAEADKEQPE